MRQKRRCIGFVLLAVSIFNSLLLAENLLNEAPSPEHPFEFDPRPLPGSPNLHAFSEEESRIKKSSIFLSLNTPPEPLTGEEKLYNYLDHTFGISSLIRSAASAGVKQARDSVPEWGQGMDGYSARYVSGIGRKIIKNSIHHGLAGFFHEDPRYYYSGRTGIWKRSLYAAGQTFVTHTDSGELCFAYTRVLGTVSGIFISRSWYPERSRTAGEYLSSMATSFGLDAANNVVHEFWPDIKRFFFR